MSIRRVSLYSTSITRTIRNLSIPNRHVRTGPLRRLLPTRITMNVFGTSLLRSRQRSFERVLYFHFILQVPNGRRQFQMTFSVIHILSSSQ